VVAERERGNRLPTITKEELLEALKSALRSAEYWREGCILWKAPVQDGLTDRGFRMGRELQFCDNCHYT